MGKMNWQYLFDMKKSGEIKRLGLPFTTNSNTYFYDTGTGKVVKLTYEEGTILKGLFDESISVKQLIDKLSILENPDEFLNSLIEENLLMNPHCDRFVSLDNSMDEDNLRIRHLIIELTGKCNMRCKYCIYNEYNDNNRDFNTEDITFDIAKKAVDYAYMHRHPENFAVTFYGGEPLINYEVMKQVINYCLEKIKDSDLSFSLTTNLTLMTEEIAGFLAQVPNLSILISLDGPEDIHNSARIYANNKPSFEDAFNGLKILVAAVNKFKNTTLGFNCVFFPPYSKEKFDRINDFFESLDFIPLEMNVRASYPRRNTIPNSLLEYEQDKEKIDWVDWAHNKGKNRNFLENYMNLYSEVLKTSLAKIHHRFLIDKPLNLIYHNGCCIPGQRRLYVCTDGTYKVCERVGSVPNIGHVDVGLDIESIKKYYLKDYEEKSIEKCSQCWAVRLCDVCYADCYDENGLNFDVKDSYCDSVRSRYKNWLNYYHSMLEENIEIIEGISKIELV
jgi:uncharacterized protein